MYRVGERNGFLHGSHLRRANQMGAQVRDQRGGACRQIRQPDGKRNPETVHLTQPGDDLDVLLAPLAVAQTRIGNETLGLDPGSPCAAEAGVEVGKQPRERLLPWRQF